ncbi:ABC-type branched-chain amino acid transport systems, periplasmic component [hydrothermal vent metagenome]|uniref:ABC-type branched-chain amino acid transport systems, periplasmic component n=1 Tax=hydrothermal vent metagenome TaxID=652676 RepID=A0A3B0S5C4_9ZZZZ
MKKILAMGAAVAVFGAVFATSAPVLAQEDVLYVPSLSYRTGPFAGGGIPNANGFADYFTMLNERDGGIGGVKVLVEECETGYNSKKGVECYETTKGKGALVYNPLSTGITLQLVPKAPVDKIPVLSMGYGLSATAIGEKFPWGFNYPTTYWSQLSSILKYADSKGGLKGKKVGFIYLDVGYGKEPIPLLDELAKRMGFSVTKYPVGIKEMQAQSATWLKVRKERPDWMIMWGWGAMNSTAIKEAVKIRFPLDRFIGNWWSGAHADLRTVGEVGKGYMAANFSGIGKDFGAVQDVIKYVVDKGKSQVKSKDLVGDVLYNRGLFNAVVVAEAIATAQKITGKKNITGADMRVGLENFDLSEARLKELGLEGFTAPIKASCKDHEGAGAVFLQQWDGSDWKRVTDPIEPMTDIVRPMLEAAATKYIADKPGWETQVCK